MEQNNKTSALNSRHKRLLTAAVAIPAFALVACAAQAAPAKKKHHAKHKAAVVATMTAAPAAAAEAPRTKLHFDWRAVPAPVLPIAPDKFMTGDWNGYRTQLHDKGIDLRFDLITEAGGNLAGGRAQGTAYADQWGAGFSVDTVRALGWQNGGLFGFYMIERSGSPLSYYTQPAKNYTANGIEPMQIYGHGEDFRLSQAWYDQPFFDDKASLRIGFYPYGNEFGTSKVYYNFVDTIFCAHMQGLPADSKGWDDAPRGAWTARLKITPTDNFYAMTAITTIQPILTNTTQGWNLGFDYNKGYNIPAEAGYLWGIRDPHDLDGSFKLGGYFDSAHSTLVWLYSGAAKPQYQYGGYAMFEQQLYRTYGTGDQGLRVFGEVLLGDHASALWKTQFELGATWRGIGDRKNDTVNAIISYVQLNNAWIAHYSALDGVAIKNNLTTIELNYGFQAFSWLNVKPFVQYQTNPGVLYGASLKPAATAATAVNFPNTWVVGFETKWFF